MADIDIKTSFVTDNRSVATFLNQPGMGLYIPFYQRDYSWDTDNIDQLIEDLSCGIRRIVEDPHNSGQEIRFMGTIIIVTEGNKSKIKPIEIEAVPTGIAMLIDGQQRLSTIALACTALLRRIYEIKQKLKRNSSIEKSINSIYDFWSKRLVKTFSFDLEEGIPTLKPKIIRGNKDCWTLERPIDEAYKSDLSNYFANCIQAFVDKTSFPNFDKKKYGDTLLYKNYQRLYSWLKNTVANAHHSSDEFVSAKQIMGTFTQEQLWRLDRDDLKALFSDSPSSNIDEYEIVCELVQTLSVCHYLLDRCCFTTIQPANEDWAFDMFQSLNATGNPLTAIETFKPTIVNTFDKALTSGFKGSKCDKAFGLIEAFLNETKTAMQKTKRTNDYITSFLVTLDGKSVASHFSAQRKALHKAFSSLGDNIEEQEEFIIRMGNYAQFYHEWLKYNGEANFPHTGSGMDAELASLIILFLRASNHKMAITVLGTLYNDVIKDLTDAKENFINAVKIIGAFYFLWRSVCSNAGLDSTYRDLFKKLSVTNTYCSLSEIKTHFRETLHKKIPSKSEWIEQAKLHLKYGETGNDVVRLALIIAAHDTIPDIDRPGAIKLGRIGVSPYLNLEKWGSPHLKTIEHIAPRVNKDSLWDETIYEPTTKFFQSLGNLTLLPQELNSSAGNKGWKEKLLYYQTVAEKDPAKIQSLEEKAKELGIQLNSNTVELLKSCQFSKHLEAISCIPYDMEWTRQIVEDRTEVMLDIIWERIAKWIFD